jgi:hypothetical protein
MTYEIIHTSDYLLVVDDSEIKKGDFVYVDCPEIEVKDIREVNDYYNEQFLFWSFAIQNGLIFRKLYS